MAKQGQSNVELDNATAVPQRKPIDEQEANKSTESKDEIRKKYFGQSLSYLTESKKCLEAEQHTLEEKLVELQKTYAELVEQRKKIGEDQVKALSDLNNTSLEYWKNDLPDSLAGLSAADVAEADNEVLEIVEQKKQILQGMKDVESEKAAVLEQLDKMLSEKAEEMNSVHAAAARVAQTNKFIKEAIQNAGSETEEEETEETSSSSFKFKPKRLVANKVSWIHFLNISDLLKEDCEMNYGVKNIVINYVIAFILIALTGLLYELQFPYVLMLCLVYFIFGPSLTYYRHRKKYEQKNFTNVVRYIEQMIYPFTRRSKLLTALEETSLLLSSGRIGQAIEYAIDKLRHGKSKTNNLYSDALSQIEALYPCTRVKNLHSFIVDVERIGGKHSTAMDIMLDDVREWDVRTNNFQQERVVKGYSLLLSIFMSLGVCFFMTNVLPDDMGGNISGYALYQVLTTISLIVMFLLYLFGSRKLTRSWVNDDLGDDEQRIKSDYETVKKYYENPAGKVKPIFAITRMQTALEKAFPRWVTKFSLLASTKTVPVALTESAADAPIVLQGELNTLIAAIEKDPASVAPYVNFFKDYDMPQIRSMMMMVYSLGSADNKDIEKHILSIVKRNHLLQATAEKLENEQKLSMFTLYTTVPMLVACVVMMIDVAMIVMNMLNTVL